MSRRGKKPAASATSLGRSLRAHLASTETLLALGVVIWSIVGLTATSRQAVWYEVRVEKGAEAVRIAEVKAQVKDEARVARAAFALAGLVAGYRVLVAGRFLGLLSAACGLTAAGAVGWFLYDLDRHGGVVREVLELLGEDTALGLRPTVDLDPAVWLALGSAALIVAFGVADVVRVRLARRAAVSAQQASHREHRGHREKPDSL